MTQFQPSFSCQTDGLTFDCRILQYTEEVVVDSVNTRCSGSVAAGQAQIISPPPPCLTVSMKWLCWYAVSNMINCLNSGLVCSKNIVPGVLWFVQMQLCKPKLCCHVLFKEKKLSLFLTNHTRSVFEQVLLPTLLIQMKAVRVETHCFCFLSLFNKKWHHVPCVVVRWRLYLSHFKTW